MSVTFRQYEDPGYLEKRLKEARDRFCEAARTTPEDLDRLIDLANDIAELEERVNFAWMDKEYDEEGRYEV